jgi:anaerobic magnesium-protoporphyrin IX monomethyl ester cyclase
MTFSGEVKITAAFEISGSRVRKNAFRPLMTAEEMETLPFAKYGTGEFIYKPERGFVPVTIRDYLRMNGLSYTTVWSIGCPLHCTFCGNTKFIANDKNYARVRHPSAKYAVEEVKHAKSIHGHIQNVLFHDDSFMAIKTTEIEEFAKTWRNELNLPFAVFGVIPNYVREDKLQLLTWAGMYRVRMGIQSGSDRILKFYKRPTPLDKVEAAVNTISKFARYHVNPSYDIIVDNPVETRQDVIDTLELLYRMSRPYQLNIFSLRVIPNTVLEQQMIEHGLDIEEISANYCKLKPTFANILLYLLILGRPPRWLFDILLKKVRATREPQKLYPLLIILIRLPWLAVQGWRHARVGDLSVMGGKLSYISYAIWKAGLLRLWLKVAGHPEFILKKELAAKVGPSFDLRADPKSLDSAAKI